MSYIHESISGISGCLQGVIKDKKANRDLRLESRGRTPRSCSGIPRLPIRSYFFDEGCFSLGMELIWGQRCNFGFKGLLPLHYATMTSAAACKYYQQSSYTPTLLRRLSTLAGVYPHTPPQMRFRRTKNNTKLQLGFLVSMYYCDRGWETTMT